MITVHQYQKQKSIIN